MVAFNKWPLVVFPSFPPSCSGADGTNPFARIEGVGCRIWETLCGELRMQFAAVRFLDDVVGIRDVVVLVGTEEFAFSFNSV